MKIFAFFMACLVLVLSLMPCADGASGSKESKAELVIAKSDMNHSETGEDDCSPFCQCSCCAGFSINHRHSAVDFATNYSASRFSAFHSPNANGIALPVWQPPRLV